MRQTPAILALTLLLAFGVGGRLVGQTGVGLPQPIYWGQEVFLIPYQWSAGGDASSAKEVILYLSKDQGRHWSEVTRAKPDVRSFLYRAAGEGEYWFAVRTIDNQGRMWPSGGYRPELRVIVDTQIPKLAVAAGVIDSEGRLRAILEASDANIDPNKLRVEVRSADSGQWTPVRTSLEPVATPGVIRARVAWQAPAGRDVYLRAAIQDRADNPASASTMVKASADGAASLAGRSNRAAPLARPVPGGDPFLAAPPVVLPGLGSRHLQQEGATGSAEAASPPVESTSQAWAADSTTARPFRPDDPGAWRPARPRESAVAVRSPERSPYHSASASQSRGGLVSVGQGARQAEPSPENLLLVNQPRFALEYDLESEGRWGVSKVEVWGSQDGGQTWRSYAVDSDNRSPVKLTTPGAGRYGFRILVEGVGGLPVEPPMPGDTPEVWVEVDPHKPKARLGSVKQGEAYFADHLIIPWQAEDKHLESRPVALFYSSRPDGPWAPIASNLENESPYSWRLQRHLPTHLYLRMEVRDRAGNVAIDQTPQPVALNFSRPAGRIRSARPLPQ